MADNAPLISESALPPLLAEIARITSVDHAIAIAREYGGQRLYVPQESRLKRDHPLARLVGFRAARLIAGKLGHQRYDIPSARAYMRWHDARVLSSQGKSHSEIARKIGVSVGHVAYLLRDFEGSPLAERAAPPVIAGCPICGHRHRPKSSGRAAPDPRQFLLF